MQRNLTLDITRTTAIVLMVVFHFIYDLKYFGWLQTDIPDGNGWQQFRWLIISLFFLCLGASLTLAHSTHFGPKKFMRRLVQISLGAGIISLGSYYALPQNWIFFGVLHFLALSSVLVIGLVRYPVFCAILGISILVFGALQILPSRWPFHLLFSNLPSYTNDYVAIQPWLGMVLLGISVAHTRWFKQDPLKPIMMKVSAPTRHYMQAPGNHSLLIYLLHQPILMGVMYIIHFLLRT